MGRRRTCHRCHQHLLTQLDINGKSRVSTRPYISLHYQSSKQTLVASPLGSPARGSIFGAEAAQSTTIEGQVEDDE